MQAADVRSAALRLRAVLLRDFWDGATLGGPDQGVRWHIRVGRFVKSALPRLSRGERHVFRQGQGYWALSHWELHRLTGDSEYLGIALAVAEECLASQLPDGAWSYPLHARRHLKATVEGDFGAICLLRAFEHTGDVRFRNGALRWHRFVEQHIRYERPARGGLAVHYFDRPRGMVPNNTAEWIWMLGEYARVLLDSSYLSQVGDLLTFLETVQCSSGELPYELPGEHEPRYQPHYLCYQYNSFQALKLWWFFEAHGDRRAGELARRLTRFVSGGVRDNGASRAACGVDQPEVNYHTDVLALALRTGAAHGMPRCLELSRRCIHRSLSRQRPDGGYGFSTGDYGFLEDNRPYPRNLAMSLFHLLRWAALEEQGTP